MPDISIIPWVKDSLVSARNDVGSLPVQFDVQTGYRRFNRKYAVPNLTDGAENEIHTLLMSGGI